MSKGSRDRTRDYREFGKTMDRIRRNERRKRQRLEVLAELTREAQEWGLYDLEEDDDENVS